MSFEWLNEESRKFLSRGYILNDITAEERIRQIGDRAEEILGIEGYSNKFYDYMGRGFFSLSSPIWANFGTPRALPISCFSSHISDTMDSILSTAKEVGIMTQKGGGTSGYFGEVRGRGEPITHAGTSDGSVNFMRLFDTLVDVTKQSGVRRGSFAAYLPIDHKDIYEFLKIKTEGHPIQGIFTGVCVDNEWMQFMINGDQEKRKLWAEVLRSRCEIGLPYLFFTDNVNDNTVDVFKDLNLKINGSNLCVAPETLLLTKDGEFPIKDLDGQTVEIWNGKQWSNSLVSKTGIDQKLLELTFVSYDESQPVYSKIQCTEYHKFYIQTESGKEKELSANELDIDDVIKFTDQFKNEKTYALCFKDFKGRYDDTYCVTEPLEHKAIFNGILTGNCSEVMLPSNEEYSFVCDLSSINLAKYNEWKDTDAVEVITFLLDTVMTEFIDKATLVPGMERALKFAKDFRALGLGVLGWHDFLQQQHLAFDSIQAFGYNNQIYKVIKEQSYAASEKLFTLYGASDKMKPYKRANATLMTIAPTTSSAFICGQTSQSIEPYRSNYYVKDLAKTKTTIKNPHLLNYLESIDKNTDAVWKSILQHGGSVQHLDFLDDQAKEVFKTFGEISQLSIIKQAAERQKFIDQGQSLNLMIHPDTSLKDINALHVEAWKSGIKTLYYQHSTNAAQLFSQSLITCNTCEG